MGISRRKIFVFLGKQPKKTRKICGNGKKSGGGRKSALCAVFLPVDSFGKSLNTFVK
jgi:hypothetical protein